MVAALYAVAQTGLGAAASSGVAALGSGIADAIGGLFGNSEVDKKRRAEIQSLYARALGGDGVAFRQLEFHAFEKRTGQPGDLRPRAADGSASPPASRAAAKAALKDLVARGRNLSKPEYYAAIGVAAPQTLLQRVVGAAAGGVADAARPVVREEISGTVQQTLRDALPYIIGVVVAIALGAFFIARGARK